MERSICAPPSTWGLQLNDTGPGGPQELPVLAAQCDDRPFQTLRHPKRSSMQSPIVRLSWKTVCAASFIVIVGALGVSLAFQGWNSRPMNFDHVDFIDGAAKLLS